MKFRSAPHLAFVRKKPCCVCGNECGNHAHHLRINHGMGMKASDEWTVPLCPNCHLYGPDAVHRYGSKLELDWFLRHGVDAKALAIVLFKKSPHKEHKPKKAKSKWPKLKGQGFKSKPMAGTIASGVKRRFDGTVITRGI